MALTYHQLGMTAHRRGRLDDAEDWHRKSLTIKEDLGNRPGMALTYAQLGLLAEARAQAALALQWNIRCVTLFGEFPSPQTGTGPSALARLARQLGMPALQAAWQQITGQPVPQEVRHYIASHHDDDQPGGTRLRPCLITDVDHDDPGGPGQAARRHRGLRRSKPQRFSPFPSSRLSDGVELGGHVG